LRPRRVLRNWSSAWAASTAGAGAASAATTYHQPHGVAYGSVELSGPLQYESFLALQGYGRDHGFIDYTNWTYAEPGSGVYAPTAGSDALVFALGGSMYAHTLNGAGLKLVALSPTELLFYGTGSYTAGGAGATWKISGQVNGDRFRATIIYNGSYNPGYKVTLSGKIASNGSASGTAYSPGQSLTFTMPVGSFFSVLHYITPLRAAAVTGHNATFRFVIPASAASSGLAGVTVNDRVHDGGRGRAHDTAVQDGTQYQIIGGPGITVR
jgi:hypothetical protein